MITNVRWTRLVASVAVALCFVLPGAAAQAAPGDPVLDPEEQALCKQINSFRAQHRLAPVKVSVALTKSAKWLSADMARNDYLNHTDSLGRDFSRRITAFGYHGAFRSENIGGGSAGAAGALAQWKSSAPHRKNLLNRAVKVIGIGHAYGAGSMLGWYWAATFGGTADRTIAC